MEMDIVLVDSLSYSYAGRFPQLGLLSLRQILESKYLVELVNFDYLWSRGVLDLKNSLKDTLNDCAKYILDFNPRVVGFYTICDSYQVTVLLAKLIKVKRNDIIITFGGPQATLTAKESLKAFPFIDYICIGESELIIQQLMEALIKKRFDFVENLSNMAYRKNGEININQSLPIISNEELSIYSVKNHSPFEELFDGKMNIEVGRGCPFNCSFCSTSSFWGRKFRVKPIDEIISEMKYFSKKYGVTEFKFEHDMFTCNKKYIKSFCYKIIEEDLPFTWTCSSRIDTLDDEIIHLMRMAKCIKMYVGIESGSSYMQNIIHKNLNLEKAKHNLILLHKSEIELTVSFIYGFPDETMDSLQETMDMICYLYNIGIENVQLHMFIPLPNTEEELKINDQLFFCADDINIGISHTSLKDKEVQELILSYPKIFSQFYTFKSLIKDNSATLSFFILYISSSIGTFNCCLKYFIRKYGLFGLYQRWIDRFENTKDRINTYSIAENFNFEDKYRNPKELIYQCILEELKMKDKKLDNEIKNYFEAESQLYKFEKNNDKYFTFEFNFDYMEAKVNNKYIEKQTFIIFKKPDNNHKKFW